MEKKFIKSILETNLEERPKYVRLTNSVFLQLIGVAVYIYYQTLVKGPEHLQITLQALQLYMQNQNKVNIDGNRMNLATTTKIINRAKIDESGITINYTFVGDMADDSSDELSISNSTSEDIEQIPDNEIFRAISIKDLGIHVNKEEFFPTTLPPVSCHYEVISNMITKNVQPDFYVLIGDTAVHCHLIVLQIYSEYFYVYKSQYCAELPETEVSPEIFQIIYNWMLADHPILRTDKIIEIFHAANYLKIKELIDQCWTCLCDDTLFTEHLAFSHFNNSWHWGQVNVAQLLVVRISRCFLTLVSTEAFVNLATEPLCEILRSHRLAINTETEIFMSAVHWLSHDWENRKASVIKVLGCVRFEHMPQYFLIKLLRCNDCTCVRRVLEGPEINKMINDGITYRIMKSTHGDDEDRFREELSRFDLTIPSDRCWIYDPNCKYHHHRECPNYTQSVLTYRAFLKYLESLRNAESDYWTIYETDEEKALGCCQIPQDE